MVGNDLLVIADAAAQIADPGREAHLRCWGFVRTRPDLSDLTFRLLIRVVEFLAKRLAVDVLCGSNVDAQQLLCIGIAKGNVLTVADIRAKRVEVAIEKSSFTLLIRSIVLALSALRAATALVSMALASSAVPWSAAKAVGESVRTAAVATAIMNVRIMDFLTVGYAPQAACARARNEGGPPVMCRRYPYEV